MSVYIFRNVNIEWVRHNDTWKVGMLNAFKEQANCFENVQHLGIHIQY